MKKLELKDALSLIPAIQQGNGVAVSVLNGKKVKARSKVFYIAGLGNAIAANSNQLILPSTVKTNGYNNFDKGNVLASGRNILVTGARWIFDTTTSSVTPLIATYVDAAPPAFLNGEFVISQSGSGNLLESPIGPFAKNGAAINAEDQFRAVTPFMIRELAEFNIQALLVGTGASTTAWRLELDAIEFTDSDNS
ncbi:hypothetical protein [Flavobacterium sp.]|uniref:hypothetical protein n=1 Tax=Flavobacterium sp. TaxID=239 RepID=UPI004034AA26